MKDHSNLIETYTITENGWEYLCAEENYGHVGVDDAVFAKRPVGNPEWQHIALFEHDSKQPCGIEFIFGRRGYFLPKVIMSKNDFLEILKKLDI